MSKARDIADLGAVTSRLDTVGASDGALSNRNVVVNGAVNIDQRNTTGTASGVYGPDRHKQVYGVSTTSIQQTSVSSGTDPYALGFRNAVLITNTSASSAANHYAQSEYRFEGQDLNRMGWDFTNSASYVTLSFWAKSSVAGTYSLFIDDNAQTNRISFSYTLAANTWKKVEFAIQGDSALTIPDDGGMRCRIVFIQSYGSSYLTSSHVNGQWAPASGSSYAPDQDHSWGNTASATWEMTGLQLENGNVATPFEHRSYGDELARCQRYYNKIEMGSPENVLPVAAVWSNNTAYGQMPFPVRMRATPSFVYPGGSNFIFYSAGSSAAPNYVTQLGSTKDFWGIQYSSSTTNWTLGNTVYGRRITSSAYISFDAEL